MVKKTTDKKTGDKSPRNKNADDDESAKLKSIIDDEEEMDKMDSMWTDVLPTTETWKEIDMAMIADNVPFAQDDVFNEKESSIHNRSKLGHRMMNVKSNDIASPSDWKHFFAKAFEKGEEFYRSPSATIMREFAIKLALSSPKVVFNQDLWKDGELMQNAITNPWMGAYLLMGATWTKHKKFKEYLEDEDDEMETDDVNTGVANKDTNNVYIHLPLEAPEKRQAMFNVYNRQFITFIKFKTPQFEGEDRRSREVEFIEAIKEMLATLWEMDPTILLIPWEADSKARALKKNTIKFPNTSDGWRIYVNRVFLKQNARCWPRMRIAHNLHSTFLEDKDLMESFRNNNSHLMKEPIQVYESSKVGWFLGSHTSAFNVETMKMSLSQQEGLTKIPVHLKVEYIRLDNKIPGKVKAVHIYTEKDKAFACRSALIKIYSRDDTKALPMGKNMRFIPDILDTRFVTTKKTRLRVKRCEAKQKVFLEASSTARNFTILGLDYYHPKLGMTLRHAIMGIRSVAEKERNLFLAVDKQATSNVVVFAFHNDLAFEATTVVSALPVLLEARYGVHIWKWFHDDAHLTSAGYEWDDDEGIVEKKEAINMNWNGPEEDDDETMDDVVVEGAGRFTIDLNQRGRSELGDGGSTVRSWRSTLKKRKVRDSSSVASSLTSNTTNDIERFKHLIMTDPTYRAEVLNVMGKIHNNNSSPALADINSVSTAGKSSSATS